jgi:hypothetical protein
MKLRKKIVTLFCLLVLSTQMLPLRQIGSIISNNQLTEELPHSMCGKSLVKFDPGATDPFETLDYELENFRGFSKFSFIHFASDLPPCHTGEIHTPPPNAPLA